MKKATDALAQTGRSSRTLGDMGAVKQLPKTIVKDLRDAVKARGGYDLICKATDGQLSEVLRRCALDNDIAATAVTMHPMPAWVRKILA